MAPEGDGEIRFYGSLLYDVLSRVAITKFDPASEPAGAVDTVVTLLRDTSHNGKRVFFVGNGGSAAISSHCAADFLKNGRFRVLSLHDPAVVTCISNDLGYEHLFEEQIRLHGASGDVLIAISSSGRSPSILNAVRAAREASMHVITLSGFDTHNPLRSLGDLNFHVPSSSYGLVEIAHLTICHAILDRAMGLW